MSRHGWKRFALSVAALAITAACGDPGEDTPEPQPDAAGAPDGAEAAPDAAEAAPDAAPVPPPDAAEAADDAAPPDAAPPDAAPPDAAPVPPPDAGPPPTRELTAIVQLSNCSGSIVRLKNARPTDRALVLTNGHCIGGGGFLDPGEVVVGRQVSRRMNVLEPSALNPPPAPRIPPRTGNRVEVTANELVYATMTTTDMALYRLTITYQELERDHGVYALTLLDRHPEAGTAILIPSGYWHTQYSCAIDAFVHQLREGEWTFEDSIRYTNPGCETIGGTSGSPIVSAATHEVIGVNNTANEGGVTCSINNPCEVDPEGHTMPYEDGRYGQQIYWLYGCLSPTSELDFDLPGCRLPGPTP